MKRTNKITLSALLSALAVVVMLCAYFPYLTYAIPAFAGLFIMISLLEIGNKWALLSYITSSALTILLCEKEAMLMYVFIFGYYPILKAFIERIKKPILEWLIKMLFFNLVIISVYLFIAGLFGIDLSKEIAIGKYMEYIILAMGNIVFVVYDITVSRMASFYIYLIRPKIHKLLK